MRLLNNISTTLLKESPSDNFKVLIIFYNKKGQLVSQKVHLQ